MFIPSGSKLEQMLVIYSTVLIGTIFVFMLIGNYLHHQSLYRKINKVTRQAETILNGQAAYLPEEHEEGELAKLVASFNQMSASIHNHLQELRKEKQFLVELLSDISHQLKTPLASLMMFNELLSERDLDRFQRDAFLKSGRVQLNRMEWLIQSLLKLAKLDAGAIVFKRESQPLLKTVETAIALMKKQAEKAKVELRIEGEHHLQMAHDKEWLSEGLINLIKNSIEHTPEGGTITIAMEETPLFYRISVRDTGKGIPEQALPHIFKRFYRSAQENQGESVGIGLSLSKSIIEGHGGLIEAMSQVGEGTTFHLSFPKY